MFHISRRGNIQIANAKQCYLNQYPSNIQRFNFTKITLPIGLEKVVPEKFKFYMFREYLDICITNKSLKSQTIYFINILFLNMFGLTVPIKPNLTGSNPQLNHVFTLRIYLVLTQSLLKLTKSKRRVVTESYPDQKYVYTPVIIRYMFNKSIHGAGITVRW